MKALDIGLCALTSGALLSLTHGFVPALGVVAVVPLFVMLRGASGREAFYGGLTCGLLESAILLGILNYHWTLYAGLCLLYGLERAVFGVGFRFLGQKCSVGLRCALAPALWVLLEYVHVLLPGSLPNLLGDTQHYGVLLPLARVGGTYLIAFILIGVNVCVAEGLGRWHDGKSQGPFYRVLVVFGVLLCLLYGAAWHTSPDSSGERRRVAIVQGGFPHWVNRAARDEEVWKEVPLNIYGRLSLEAEETDLTVWPEAAAWNYWGADDAYEERLWEISKERGALLVGALRRDEGGTPFNSGLLLEGGTLQFADKQRLVMQEELMFGLGDKPAVFQSPAMGSLGVVFCLESVVPSYTRTLVLNGVEAVVVLASGSDLGRTPVARIHAQRSIVRAVEIGRPVIHAGNHGFSMLIDPWGNVQGFGPVFESAVITGTIHLWDQLTWFSRFGFVPLFLLSVAVVGLAVLRRFQGYPGEG